MTARRDARALAAAAVLYGVFYTAVFLKSLLTGNYIAPSDALDLGIADYLSSPALWTQGMYSGYPIAADPQSLMWYPILQLFRVLGVGWNVFMVTPYVVASATCFLLVRRLTGSNVAAAFSGVVYGFSGPMLGNMGHFNQIHAASWVPLALYGLQLIREGLGRSGAAVTSLAFALMWLAGHPQLPVYALYLSAALLGGGLLIDRPPKTMLLNRVLWSGVGVGLGTGLAAIMIVPTIELAALTVRSGSNWDLYIAKALPPWQLLTLAFPFSFGFWAAGNGAVPYLGDGSAGENLTYVGLLALALAVAGPFVLSTFRREARLWVALAAVAALLCLGAATPIGTLFFHAPGYARFRVPSRHLFLVALCIAVGSGLGVAELTRRRDGGYAIAFTMALILAVTAVAFAVFAWVTPAVWTLVAHSRTYSSWTLGWPLVLTLAIITLVFVFGQFTNDESRPMAFGLLLIAVQVTDLAMLHYRVPGIRYEYADIVRQDVVPHPRMVALRQELQRTGERVLAVDGTHDPFLLPNLTRPWDVPAAGGSGPLGIERYLDVLKMGGPGDVPDETLSTAHRGLDLFAIRYALVPERSPLTGELLRDPGRWSAVEHLRYDEDDPDSQYTLFRNARALARAWCVGAVVGATPEESLTAIRSGRLPGGGEFDPAHVALVEPGAFPGWNRDNPSPEAGSVTVQLGPRPRYIINSPTPCLLVLSEVYYPWWRASLDDAPVDTALVNHAMIGIAVPAGSHAIRLRLQPVSLWVGGATSGACVLVWIGLVVTVRKEWNVRAGDARA